MGNKSPIYWSILILSTMVLSIGNSSQAFGDKNSITGAVHDDHNDKPIIGVYVYEVDHKTEINDSTETEAGIYNLLINTSYNPYNLIFEHSDYLTAEIINQKNEGERQKKDVCKMLKKGTINQLGGDKTRELLQKEISNIEQAEKLELKGVLLLIRENLVYVHVNMNPRLKEKQEFERIIEYHIEKIDKIIR